MSLYSASVSSPFLSCASWSSRVEFVPSHFRFFGDEFTEGPYSFLIDCCYNCSCDILFREDFSSAPFSLIYLLFGFVWKVFHAVDENRCVADFREFEIEPASGEKLFPQLELET